VAGDLVEQLGRDGPDVTAPPVPGCLVITDDPSAATSAMGKPGCSSPGISVKKA